MKGKHTLRIQSAHLRYDLTFHRNITVIQGDSASGKTTLVEMIQEYLLNGTDTGISLVCDCPCRVLAGNTWKEQLAGIENSIVFIDEGNRFISSVEFAAAVKGSSNYYVIITREALDNLPYSVTEIYGIKSSGRFASLEPVYHQMYRIYGNIDYPKCKADLLVTEDSNAGYEFFSELVSEKGIASSSAEGASNLFELLKDLPGDIIQAIAIADGAAFGSQMGRIYKLIRRNSKICLYLPESFEWLILSSDVLDDGEIRAILEKPFDYIDGSNFFSWERFFTSLLTEKTNGTWLQYTKSKLNPVYLKGKCKKQIIEALPA